MKEEHSKGYDVDLESKTESIRHSLMGKDKDHVWAFCSGQYSQDFRGNPKYLFLYINKYRPDIFAYWFCDNPEVVNLVREMGYVAFYNGTAAAAVAIEHTGVLVSEQVKAEIPEGLYHAKYLNLWHGVGGVKVVERSIKEGHLIAELARKYIRHNEYYRTYELYVAPSSFIEGIAKEQLGLTDKQIIRAGYPRDIYQKQYDRVSTFDHNILEARNLPSDTRIAAYIPTRREFYNSAFFTQAVPDMDKLIKVCEKKHLFFIFKMHPFYENDANFLQAKERYSDCPWLMFWDNQEDIYEILDRIDLCIMDYSSMFTDMIVAGVKHYIRYMFDFDEEDLNFPMDYDKVTPGRKCKTFDELLEAIDTYESEDLSESLSYIHDLYWEYSTPDSMEKIIEQTIAFKPEKPQLQTLYSFDIFDTVISRKVLSPIGIFYKVQELMRNDGSFPSSLVCKYPEIHKNTELIIREYYRKSTDIRHSDNLEISLDEILERIGWIYGLSAEQIEKLRNWEIETEIENAIPLPKQIELIRKYLAQGDKVILISDMYLPKDVIVRMLEKADPFLTELPLFLSNEYGVLKAHKSLYYEVYKTFEPFYDFKKWIHHGDNIGVDQNAARSCGINTRLIQVPEFNDIQNELVKYTDSYDGYLVAALQSRICAECMSAEEQFVASYVTLLMVPYIDWVLRDAVRREYKTLYFISRDGHPLKYVADAIIAERGLDIKTKYIYASRRTWRIPSFINEVDPCFWESYANFGDIISKEKLLRAMSLDEETFKEFFPHINLDEIDFTDKKSVPALTAQFRVSSAYNQYLLDLAAKERPLVSNYLRQEIDAFEKFAVVEYWGRGYTQDTMIRLWQDITKEKSDVPFYYTRTVLPSAGNAIRYNFTTNSMEQFFIEGYFANMPYKSIERYCVTDGKIEPVIEPIPYNKSVYDAMQKILPLFAREYVKLELLTPEDTDHLLYDFVLDYYRDNRDNKEFSEHIGSMIDSVAAYGRKREFAPPLTMDILDRLAQKELQRGDSTLSTCITMSVVRAEDDVKERYNEMYQILPGDDVAKGRLLSDEEQAENRQAEDRYISHKKRTNTFRVLYRKFAENTNVTNTILFVSAGKTINDFTTLIERIKQDTRYNCEKLLLGNYSAKEDEKIARKIAGARFIICGGPIPLFSQLVFRAETEYLMLPFAPFQLYNAGITQYNFLKWKQKLTHLNSDNRFSQIQVPAVNEKSIFLKRYSKYGEAQCDILGNCITDCYFDPEFIARSKQKVYTIFPNSKNKKMILYMPTLRTRPNFPEWISMIDMEILCRLIGKEYVVLINFNLGQLKNEYKNVIEILGFSKNMTNEKSVSIRELISAADVIVGDYRDSFFETAMLHKPVYSTAWDYEKITRSLNMSQNAPKFDSLLFCPVVETAEQLAEQLKQIDHYDYSKMESFREQYFGACDGKSIERVVSYLADRYILTPEQKAEDEYWKEQYQSLEERARRFSEIYNASCNTTSISDTVLFLAEKKNKKNTGMKMVQSRIADDLHTDICYIDENAYQDIQTMEVIADRIAAAKLIVSNTAIKLLCRTKIREGTSYLLLKDNPFPLSGRSHRKVYFSEWRNRYNRLAELSNYTHIQVPAPEQTEAFTNLYLNRPVSTEAIVWGCCLSDMYFNETAIMNSKAKLSDKLGDFAGKKTILYMPTLGNSKGREKLPIDLVGMRAAISDEYVIILNLKGNQKAVLTKPLVVPYGCIEISTGFSLMELVMACDIIIGDYRNTFFEAALLDKPCFSTAYDSDEVIKASSKSIIQTDIHDMQFCPVVRSAKELAEQIDNIDSYDYSAMKRFCKTKLTYCDGHSVDRVVEMIKQLFE